MTEQMISAAANFCGAGLGLAIMAFALWDSRRQQERARREQAQAEAARQAWLDARADYWSDMCRQGAIVEDVVEEVMEA